ncbi:MAG: hypothetical protein ACC619_00295, partial [Paracoccaceae bacterium]
YAALHRADAAFQVADADDLAQVLLDLSARPGRAATAARARRALQELRRTQADIKPLMARVQALLRGER